MSKLKGMMLGALAGTFLASTYALFGSRPDLVKKFRDQTQDLADKARIMKENIFDDMHSMTESKRARSRKTFLRGAILGLLLGAGSAALFSPKTGKQLRKDLTHKYKGMADKTQDIVDFINQNGYRKPIKKLSRILAKKRSSLARHKRPHAPNIGEINGLIGLIWTDMDNPFILSISVH